MSLPPVLTSRPPAPLLPPQVIIWDFVWQKESPANAGKVRGGSSAGGCRGERQDAGCLQDTSAEFCPSLPLHPRPQPRFVCRTVEELDAAIDECRRLHPTIQHAPKRFGDAVRLRGACL